MQSTTEHFHLIRCAIWDSCHGVHSQMCALSDRSERRRSVKHAFKHAPRSLTPLIKENIFGRDFKTITQGSSCLCNWFDKQYQPILLRESKNTSRFSSLHFVLPLYGDISDNTAIYLPPEKLKKQLLQGVGRGYFHL